jgi:hypothetical protein
MNVTPLVQRPRSGDYVGRWLWVGQWLDRNGTGNTTQPPTWLQLELECLA